jgi:hypothetical protein
MLCSAAAIGITGCGGAHEFKVAPVSGKVDCNGAPLKDGLVVFIPIPKGEVKSKESGRSASGVIQPDGSYQLTTYNSADGAIIGSHNVQVFAPAPIDDDAPLTDANRFACGNAPLEKTVVDGNNVIDLELSVTKPSDRRK